jgi:hypothetical protein
VPSEPGKGGKPGKATPSKPKPDGAPSKPKPDGEPSKAEGKPRKS